MEVYETSHKQNPHAYKIKLSYKTSPKIHIGPIFLPLKYKFWIVCQG